MYDSPPIRTLAGDARLCFCITYYTGFYYCLLCGLGWGIYGTFLFEILLGKGKVKRGRREVYLTRKLLHQPPVPQVCKYMSE